METKDHTNFVGSTQFCSTRKGTLQAAQYLIKELNSRARTLYILPDDKKTYAWEEANIFLLQCSIYSICMHLLYMFYSMLTQYIPKINDKALGGITNSNPLPRHSLYIYVMPCVLSRFLLCRCTSCWYWLASCWRGTKRSTVGSRGVSEWLFAGNICNDHAGYWRKSLNPKRLILAVVYLNFNF